MGNANNSKIVEDLIKKVNVSSELIKNNLLHIITAVEFLSWQGRKDISIGLKVNPIDGAIFNKDYQSAAAQLFCDTPSFLYMHGRKGKLSMDSEGYFSEKARENISDTMRVFIASYL